MTDDLQQLLSLLEVERIDKFLFLGRSLKKPPRVFGGQVLAQSLNAAGRSVEPDRLCHSMHAYFLRPGDPRKQIIYEVDPIRDGGSFTTRRVVARQDGVPIFITSLSFQVHEDGLSHQFPLPDVPPPEALESDFEYWKQLSERFPDRFQAPMMPVIERYSVSRRDYLDPQPKEPEQHIWFRVAAGADDLGDNPVRHQTLLAFMSDYALLGTALLPHPLTGHSPGMQIASLDHALWFHRPLRADEFLLYVMDSPSSFGGRGMSRGSFYTRSGELVASVAQESLIRQRSSGK
ncbi:acyl-CoA thioesterase [Haliea atlantica]|nr:acyl-CoA thioesterase II [Haliea sp.]